MPMLNISLLVEIGLSVLLLATIVYCAVLERKLSALRKGQDGLKDTIARLNESIVAAGSSMRMLISTAAGAAEALDERMVERSTTPRAADNVMPMPASLGARLEALKPQALRNVR